MMKSYVWDAFCYALLGYFKLFIVQESFYKEVLTYKLVHNLYFIYTVSSK